MLPSGSETGVDVGPRRVTPYELVTRHEVTRPTTKSFLVARCRGLEREALGDPPVAAGVLLQDVRHLTPATLGVYARLAALGTDVTFLGRGMQAWLAPGVRGVALDDDDPLGDVWALVLVSPRRPVALAALDLFTDGATEAERDFEVAVSRDPQVVAACARALDLPGSGSPVPGLAVSDRSGPGTSSP